MKLKIRVGNSIVDEVEVEREEEIYKVALAVGAKFGMKKIIVNLEETDDGLVVEIQPYNLGG